MGLGEIYRNCTSAYSCILLCHISCGGRLITTHCRLFPAAKKYIGGNINMNRCSQLTRVPPGYNPQHHHDAAANERRIAKWISRHSFIQKSMISFYTLFLAKTRQLSDFIKIFRKFGQEFMSATLHCTF